MPNDFAIIKDALSRIGAINDLETENALLRKVADAARVLSDIWSVGGKPNLSNLRYALAELNKEGEK
jgi:hypothetical protein